MASQVKMGVDKVKVLCKKALENVAAHRRRIDEASSKTWKSRWLGYEKSWAGWRAYYAAEDLLRLAEHSGDGFVLVGDEDLESILEYQ